MLGIGGYKNALNLRDLGVGVKMSYPAKSRDTDECERYIKLFAWDPPMIKRYYGDKEGGVVAAMKAFKVPCRFSQPSMPKNNILAERANQDILQGSRAVLAAAGLPECFWLFVASY